ncbi:hypothetical protein J1N35_018028 [Gossypium stocksii]|uniref:Uncharacterized protein n=1 Tax=Gossypium stocksii TaxID=47602 RepID=A0A9D3VN80_9ROSI|nr:hypothetical protein J1N35_018028 [Gossypium stocksii]
MSNYMPWFRIHSKPYLLSEEHRRRKIRVGRERRGLLNPMRRDDGTCPSIVQTQSPGPMPQLTAPTSHPLQIISGAYPSPFMYPNPYMISFTSPMPAWNAWASASLFPITPTQPTIYRPLLQEGSYEAPSGALLITNLHCLMGFKHLCRE